MMNELFLIARISLFSFLMYRMIKRVNDWLD